MKVWTVLLMYSMYIYQCWIGGEVEEEERVRQTGVGQGRGRVKWVKVAKSYKLPVTLIK